MWCQVTEGHLPSSAARCRILKRQPSTTWLARDVRLPRGEAGTSSRMTASSTSGAMVNVSEVNSSATQTAGSIAQPWPAAGRWDRIHGLHVAVGTRSTIASP